MRALKVEAEGLTTSFRYPHFLVGRQPTFRMPPPATIYGHVCSAVGEFMDPHVLRFAYVFRHSGVGDDLELLHLATVARGKWPGGGGYPKNLEVTTNPAPREVLLNPQLTLYLAAEEAELGRLEQAFRAPHYVVTLGRSQDLMAYRSVDVVELEQAPAAYLEGTLLPWAYRLRTLDGIGVTMPRFIDPHDRRQVAWTPYVMLQGRVRTAAEGEPRTPLRGVLARGEVDERWWVDPSSPEARGLRRGVIWLSFVGNESDERVFVGAPAAPLG